MQGPMNIKNTVTTRIFTVMLPRLIFLKEKCLHRERGLT